MGLNRNDPSPLADVLARGLSDPSQLTTDLGVLGNYPLRSAEDAQVLARAVAEVAPRLISGDSALLRMFLGLFQGVESREAFDVLRAEGVPHLFTVFDARLPPVSTDEEADSLLFLLKVASLYRVEGVVGRVVTAARRPLIPGSYLWSVLFDTFDETHPYRLALVNRLRESLPAGFLGVAYLDLSNACALQGYVSSHPFDTPEGTERLREMLVDVEHPSYARSAAAALSFLSRPARDELLAAAMGHASTDVRLTAARAGAKFGSDAALQFLARVCLDPNHGKAASDDLTELGHGGLIPSEALAPEFVAVSEMAAWLAHPMEFGRPPDAIELIDARELFWPPTNDRRRLWIVAYRYDPDQAGGEVTRGVGLVGSITFCLFDEVTAEMTSEDILALHCCWELVVNHDARAPATRSVAAGRAILQAAQ